MRTLQNQHLSIVTTREQLDTPEPNRVHGVFIWCFVMFVVLVVFALGYWAGHR